MNTAFARTLRGPTWPAVQTAVAFRNFVETQLSGQHLPRHRKSIVMGRRVFGSGKQPQSVTKQVQRIEGREWWLWIFVVVVTVVLTAGIVSFTFPQLIPHGDAEYWFSLREWVRALAALVLLFDLYTVYQHFQLQRVRRELLQRDELFRLVTENAADMIAVVDVDGKRLYNSPAYEKVLGYSPEELKSTAGIEQIHPDDRSLVMAASDKARATGRGERLEYRVRHKDGTWRILESTASAVRNLKGEVGKLVIVNRDITERKRAEQALAHHVFHDGLTGLPNRALFLDRLQHVFTLSRRRHDYKFAVFFIDLDEFKIFNDSLGHQAGDDLLIAVGKRLQTSLRSTDTVTVIPSAESITSNQEGYSLARLAGDEFTVLLDDIRDSEDAVRVAERIQQRLSAPFTVNGQDFVVTASVGIALNTSASGKAEDLLRDAEIAMHRAKRAGKACCEVFDAGMYANAVKRLRLETDLRKALERKEFRVYYQPIISLHTRNIAGFEALVRWQRPEGLVLPGEFIEIATQTGLIVPMNKWLVREACHQLRTWQMSSASRGSLSMSVNVTAKEFANPALADEVTVIIKEAGIKPEQLQLEILETIAMGEPELASDVLQKLKATGARVSIDDFGTGYSSLSRLAKLPIDTLKIDRSFIAGMENDEHTREIVRIITMLAQSLGLSVVAEGVETKSQMAQLIRFGCDLAQGYYFSPPVEARTITKLLSTQQRQPELVQR